MKGDLIGRGNTAEVFSWGNKEVLKLFYENFATEAIEREYQISRVIGEEVLQVPKAFRLIELEDRLGIIYQRVNGISLFDILTKHPFSVSRIAKQLADLHYRIHQYHGLEIPKYKEALEWNIRHTDTLTKEQKAVVLTLLEQLPEGDTLCHGDFHPGNIVREGNTFYILDWMTAANGVPAADVARTLLLLKDSALPEHLPKMIKLLFGSLRKIMAAAYAKQYYKLSGIKKEEVNSWRLVIAAARLRERVPESEKEALLKELEQATIQ